MEAGSIKDAKDVTGAEWLVIATNLWKHYATFEPLDAAFSTLEAAQKKALSNPKRAKLAV